jgi:mRNA-degrading endonuclease YafQ of YafQ-DinJ toxin-antitoxin module
MRKILTTKTFDKVFIKLSSKNTDLHLQIIETLKILSQDVNDTRVKTHKLSGNLKEFFACSVNYSIRIVFKYDHEYIYLETVGTHDEVY